MPKYTGSLNTFGLRTFVNRFPEIHMIPSNEGVVGSIVLASDPVPVKFLTSDAFEVELASVEFVVPAGTHFRMRVTWLNGDNVPIGHDYPPWKFYPGAAGGALADYIDRPLVTGEWWVGSEPGVPSSATAGDFILNPVTGQYDQIQEL